MKLNVTFREYTQSYIDPNTKERERGDYIGSFDEEIEGNTLIEIITTAHAKAQKYSKERETDVRMWETKVIVTPRGITSL